MYASETLAVTRWTDGRGEYTYQLTVKDDVRRRQGTGYIVLTAAEMGEFCLAVHSILGTVHE